MELKVIFLLLLPNLITLPGRVFSDEDKIDGDIVLILDKCGWDSKRLVQKKWNQLQIDLVNQIFNNKQTVRMSYVSYDNNVVLESDWTYNKLEIINKINVMSTYAYKSLKLAESFNMAKTQLLSKSRANVKKTIVAFITGEIGIYDNLDNVKAVLKEIRDSGVTIILIGYEVWLTNSNVRKILSPHNLLFNYEEIGDSQKETILKQIKESISNSTLNTPTTTPASTTKATTKSTADIVFILDKSWSVSKENLEKMKQFVIDMVNKLTIGSNAIRVSCISYSDKATIDFDWLDNKDDIVNELKKIQPTFGGTATGSALRLAQTKLLSNSHVAVNKLIVLLTDGKSNAWENPTNVANEIKNSKVSIFVVGIGENIDIEQFKSIASENSLFISSSFDDLKNQFQPLMLKTFKVVFQNNGK